MQDGCSLKFAPKNSPSIWHFCVNLKHKTHYSVCKWTAKLEKSEKKNKTHSKVEENLGNKEGKMGT
jgi:hypothetical protein